MIVNKDKPLLDQVCTVIAYRIYLARKQIDTEPHIVRMLDLPVGKHWYYRSNELIYDVSTALLLTGNAYVGIPELAPSERYSSEKWVPDLELEDEIGWSAYFTDFPDELNYLLRLEIPYIISEGKEGKLPIN